MSNTPTERNDFEWNGKKFLWEYSKTTIYCILSSYRQFIDVVRGVAVFKFIAVICSFVGVRSLSLSLPCKCALYFGVIQYENVSRIQLQSTTTITKLAHCVSSLRQHFDVYNFEWITSCFLERILLCLNRAFSISIALCALPSAKQKTRLKPIQSYYLRHGNNNHCKLKTYLLWINYGVKKYNNNILNLLCASVRAILCCSVNFA